jgi:hypothetical protein
MIKQKYSYRLIKSSWGIAIDVTAECTSKSIFCKKNESVVVDICPGLWGVIFDDRIPKNEVQFIWEGLRHICKSILTKSPYKNDTLITIHSVEFNFCDYQPEGLAPAIIGWAANALGFDEPELNVVFDKKENKYKFNL